MKRMAQVIYLKESAKPEYLRLHRETWPEILEVIAQANIRNYSIFLREPENLLFAYWEYHGTNFEADAAVMAKSEAMQRWWAITDRMQSSLVSSEADEQWAPMESVFFTDASNQKEK